MATNRAGRPKRNSLAVVSLGLGILCPIIALIFGIRAASYPVGIVGALAVITGLVAFLQVRKSGEGGIGSAVVGMFFGGLGLLAVLASVLLTPKP